jgi:hypothetical protein
VARRLFPRCHPIKPTFGVFLVLALAQAAVAQVNLPANSQVTPTSFNPAPGALLASVSSPFSSVGFSGTLNAAVVQNEVNTLDFYYQVTNSQASQSSLSRASNFNFSGFNSAVFFRTDNAGGIGGFVAGTETPDLADRDNFGVIGFNFLEGTTGSSGKINPGETSSILVIRTDATLFTTGITSIINGGSATVTTFAPFIPEPATVSMMALALPLLARRRGR